MRGKKSIVWGILCILTALALVLNKLGYLQGIGFWSIFFSVILIGCCVSGIYKRSWSRILFSAAFFIIINRKHMNLEVLTPWSVLGTALLCTIGLHLIFPMKHRMKYRIGHKQRAWTGAKEEQVVCGWDESDQQLLMDDGEVINQDVVFGNCVKYVRSYELRKINADCVFGQISVYFTEAEMKNNRAVMNLDVVFGQADIFVPADWNVAVDMETVAGKVSYCGTCVANGEKKLHLRGDVVFGEAVIHYV